MAELFIQTAVSLDGFIEGEGGDLDWFVVDESIDPAMTATLGGIDGMIFGRKAHALLARFWPTAGDGEAGPDLKAQARLMNGLPKYVLTHGEERTGWANSHAIRLDDVPRLKAEASRPLALYAGAEAARAALGAGQVDEVRLIAYPVLLGVGAPLFAQGGPRLDLALVDSQRFASGAVLNRYRVNKGDPDHA